MYIFHLRKDSVIDKFLFSRVLLYIFKMCEISKIILSMCWSWNLRIWKLEGRNNCAHVNTLKSYVHCKKISVEYKQNPAYSIILIFCCIVLKIAFIAALNIYKIALVLIVIWWWVLNITLTENCDLLRLYELWLF